MIKLKVGYVVEFNNDPNNLAMVTYGNGWRGGSKCISGTTTWFPFAELNADLIYESHKVTKVYGRASNMSAWKLEIGERKLLWEREIVKDMTIEEIQDELGYKIKIV